MARSLTWGVQFELGKELYQWSTVGRMAGPRATAARHR